MNREQYYLLKLGEECSEVAQIASKISQFGMHEICPGKSETNAERCHAELDDLMAMIDVLNEEFGLGYEPSIERIEAKKDKVGRYLKYSISMGYVEGESDNAIHPMLDRK